MPSDSTVVSELRSLLADARGGCAAATEQLLQQYRPLLVLLAEREVPADIRAKVGDSDVVQETLLAAHRGLAGFAGTTEAEFRAWLRQILVNQTANLVNRFRHTGKRATGREVSLDDSRMRPIVMDHLTAPDPTPSAQVRLDEERAALLDSLALLPDDHRQVVLWRHRDCLAYGEIAQRLGKTETAVRQIWARAVKRLQQELHIR
jgi:RNA polymerase sigma-70 factor (ECF subfamily)